MVGATGTGLSGARGWIGAVTGGWRSVRSMVEQPDAGPAWPADPDGQDPLTPYLAFDRARWAALRAATPLTLRRRRGGRHRPLV